jgi:SAM-dependent methyltransferase
MSAYEYLAKHYDGWMDQEHYQTWIKWIQQQLSEGNLRGIRLLELCCGTGRVTLPLAESGYAIWAVDQSEEMLAVAQQKSVDMITKIRWILGDMLDLKLKESFDAVLCINDGINYLRAPSELVRFFQICHQHLKPEGLLIFDWSSLYKLKTVLGDKVIAETYEDSAFIWENHYCDEDQCLEFDFHIFEKQSSGHYTRLIEHHRQISFALEEIESAASGLFSILKCVGDDYTTQTENDQRIHMVMRKENMRYE